MSATNRGSTRHKNDYYVTPVDSIHDFLNAFEIDEPSVFDLSDSKVILDPCAGGDSVNDMSYPKALEERGIPSDNIVTVDIRDDSPAETIADYLGLELTVKPDVVITNPPFILAREFIEKALDDVAEGGYVIMLLRLNFFGSKKRRDLWRNQMPKYSYVHSRRMSFTDDGKTDTIEYQHLVWQKGHFPSHTKLKVVGA